MASKSLKQFIIALTETEALMKGAQETWVLENNPVKKAARKKSLEQYTKKCIYLTEQILNFGMQAPIVKVSGYLFQSNGKTSGTIGISKPFELYFTGLTIEDAKDYFETIVKRKWENIQLETISFKTIPVGVLQVNYVKR